MSLSDADVARIWNAPVIAGRSPAVLLRCMAAVLYGKAEVFKTPAAGGVEEISVEFRCPETGDRALRIRLGSEALGTRTKTDILLGG